MLPNHPDMMLPKPWRLLEADLKARKPGDPHPAVVGSAKINSWFDAIVKLMTEKISLEKGSTPTPLAP